MDFRLPQPLKYSLKKKKTRRRVLRKETKKLSLKNHNKNASSQTDSSESSELSSAGSTKKNNPFNKIDSSSERWEGDNFRADDQCSRQGHPLSNISHFYTPARRKLGKKIDNFPETEESIIKHKPSYVNGVAFDPYVTLSSQAPESAPDPIKSKRISFENSVSLLDKDNFMSEMAGRMAPKQIYSSGCKSSINATTQQNRTIILSDSDSSFTTADVFKVDEQLNDKVTNTSDTQNTSSGSSRILFESSLSSEHFIGSSISIEGTTEKRMENIKFDESSAGQTKVGKKSIFRSSVLHKKFNKAVENELALVCNTSDFYFRVKNRVLGLHQSASEASASRGVSYSKNERNDENRENSNENEDLLESNKENIDGNTERSDKFPSFYDDTRKRPEIQSDSYLNDFKADKISEENPKIIVPDSEDSSIEVISPIPNLKSVDLINKVDSKTLMYASVNDSDKSSLPLEENLGLESSDSESTIQSNCRRGNPKVKKVLEKKEKTLGKKNSEAGKEFVVPESDDSSSINEYQRKQRVFVIDSSGSETSVTSKSEDSDRIEAIKVHEVDYVARNVTVSKGSNFSNKTRGTLEGGEHKSGSSDLFKRVAKRTLILDSSDSVNKTTKDQEAASNEIPCQKENELHNLQFQPGFSTLSQSKHEDIRNWLSAIPCHQETDKPKPSRGDAMKIPQPKPKGEDENITLTDMEKVLSELYGKDWGDRKKFTPKVVPKKKESQIIIARLTDSDDSSTPPLPASTPKKRLYHIKNHMFTPQNDCFTPTIGNNLFTPLTSVGKKGKTSAIKTPRTADPKSRVERACLQSGAFSSPVLTFLASLSVGHQSARCHPEAKYFVKNFKSKKEELALKMFNIFNKDVFYSKLPHDLPILWNNRLRKTAGHCYNRRVKNSEGTLTRTSRIELSSKIVDNAHRLRDTLIHELCHAATWMISEVMGGHGPAWKRWTNKAMAAFPELPKISRCHDYDIVTKYKYQCTICNYSIGRHSKSLDTERKVCGICGGKFELFLNAKGDSGKAVPKTPRTPNTFALFVKDNYKVMKASQSSLKHKDVMKLLSEKFAATKISSTSAEQNN